VPAVGENPGQRGKKCTSREFRSRERASRITSRHRFATAPSPTSIFKRLSANNFLNTADSRLMPKFALVERAPDRFEARAYHDQPERDAGARHARVHHWQRDQHDLLIAELDLQHASDEKQEELNAIPNLFPVSLDVHDAFPFRGLTLG
jgi:hypothetical protein